MCGRFTLTPENVEFVAERLGISPDEVFEERYVPRWNVAPTQEHWIVTAEREERVPHHATWGLVNWWERDRRAGAKHINARAESLETTRAYREAFPVGQSGQSGQVGQVGQVGQSGRCIIPADGFYEWTGDQKARRPFWFHRPDGDVFAFAGLYVRSRLRHEAAPMTTFTIITTDANALVGRIHDRMPVILPGAEAIDAWLHAEEPVERLESLLRPVDDDFLVSRAVSTRVNSVQHDDPACLEEAEPETQGSLL